ncbi:MAG: MotA/TolQ/ExbB proton channel family protein [Tepidisphaeraceae bacterium]
MTHSPRSILPLLAWAAAVALPAVVVLAQQPGAPPPPTPTPTEMETRSALQFVTGGGVVGYIIIALSILAVALVIDVLLRIKRDRTFPESLVRHAMELAEHGKAGELLAMSKASDTMFGRIIGGALDRGRYGIDVVRQEVQQIGEREIFKLRNRVAQIGVIATAGPMLGLLGTVIGMINSFSVLGESKNAARPDELAAGISLALITTCQGLILAVPLIFVHMYLRDRVSATSQEAAHVSEKLLGLLATGSANRQRAMAQQQQQQQPQTSAPPMPQQQHQHSSQAMPIQQQQPSHARPSIGAPPINTGMPLTSHPLSTPPLGAPPIGGQRELSHGHHPL